jgi:Uma2 family endonuclease
MLDLPAAPHGFAQPIIVQHRVIGFSESWVIPEAPVPEAAWHDSALDLLKALLVHWIARTGRDAAVFRNLAVRLRRDKPVVGFDPDLMLVTPAPPASSELSSLKLWEPGHSAPALVIEVVSPGHPYKDYSDIPDRCAAAGVTELVVFDPRLVGPRAFGGPQRLQLWRRDRGGVFALESSGEGPFESRVLGAFLVPVEGGRQLRIAEDRLNERPWPTAEEAARATAQAEKERASARIAELERELARRPR